MGITFYFFARRLIGIEGMSYLTYIGDNHMESLSLDSILVDYEFSDVFPTYLPGIPPT